MTHSRYLVVAALIERDGRFLLGKRSAHKQSAPGVWHAVCGRVELGESEQSALSREVSEETGLAVRVREKIAEADTRDGLARIHWWVAEPLDDRPAQLLQDEHSELRWVSLEEMWALSPVFPEDLHLFEAWILAR
jgi:8-oxo-dGTP diphosphatase